MLLPLFFSACASNIGDEEKDSVQNNMPISFGITKTDDWNNISSSRNGTNSSFIDGDKIGVFAYYNESSTPDFMNNQEAEYDGSAWKYSPVKYWPANETDFLSFYAYYPLDGSIVKVGNDNKKPVLTYDYKDADKDILGAISEKQTYSGTKGKVTLPFKHILAKVKYTFSTTGKNHPVVHALKYNIPYHGEYKFANPVEWASISDSKTELLRLTSKNEGEVINKANIAIDEFTAFILPCTISKFSVSINNIFVDYTPKPEVTIKAGYQYTINFVIAEDGRNVFITSYSLWKTDNETYEGQLK